MKSRCQCVAIVALLTTSLLPAEEPEMTAFETEYFANAEMPGAVVFNPPDGWLIADRTALPPNIKIMVVGKGEHEFPPSITLCLDPCEDSLRDYLKKMKSYNDAVNAEWKEVGTITTQAGQASLSQVNETTEWGEVKMMHALIVQEGTAYILTAAALKEEFPRFYKDFFTSMRSLRFNPIDEPVEKRGELKR